MRTLLEDRLLLAALAALAILLAIFVASELQWHPSDDTLLVVADLRGRALHFVDTADPASTRHVALPGGPHELLELPDGRVLASLEQAGLLAAVDPASGEVESLEVGGLPHGLALDGGVLYVTDRAAGAVRRFAEDGGPLSGWRELEPLPGGDWPHSVALAPGGTLLVVDAARSRLHLGTREIAVAALPETVALSPDGRIATAGAADGRIEVFAPDGERLLSLHVGGRPVRAAYSPDGGVLAVALSAAGSVALVDAQGVVRRVRVGGVPDGIAFSADGRTLFASDLVAGRVVLVDVHGGRVRGSLAVGKSTGALLALLSPARR